MWMGSIADSSCSPAVKSSPIVSDEKLQRNSGCKADQQRQQAEAALFVQEEACCSWEAQVAEECRELDE